jgi:uncharacterized protein (TIGR03437 family)
MFATLACATAWAAPQLRLSTAALGPYSIAQGQNGPTPSMDVWNAGDGDLALTLQSNVSWLSANLGVTRPCPQNASIPCRAVNISLATSGLAAGTYTGFLTVVAAGAIDAPQTVSVTVQMGGGVPASIELIVAPGRRASRTLTTSTRFTTRAVPAPGGPALSVSTDGGGSFRTTFSYEIAVVASEGQAEGTYAGRVEISESPLAADNKAVGVQMRVTRAGIAAPAPEQVRFKLMPGAAPQTGFIAVNNAGLGPLAVSGATAAVTGTGNWLATSVTGNFVGVTVNPQGLTAGTYSGTVTIASNAANSSVVVPVTLDIVPNGAPVASFGGVVSNATFQPGDLALGDLPAVFGEGFTFSPSQGAPSLPLSNTLAGTSVFINDQPAPVFFTSYNQVNFQVPYNAQLGPARLRVDRDGQRGNEVAIRIARANPRILVAVNGAGQAVTASTTGPLAPVRPGETLVVYCLGFGPTNPTVNAGEGAPGGPLAVIDPLPTVVVGGSGIVPGQQVAPLFVGLTPGFVGLYQVNVTIPANVSRGPNVPMSIVGPGYTSNVAQLSIP